MRCYIIKSSKVILPSILKPIVRKLNILLEGGIFAEHKFGFRLNKSVFMYLSMLVHKSIIPQHNDDYIIWLLLEKTIFIDRSEIRGIGGTDIKVDRKLFNYRYEFVKYNMLIITTKEVISGISLGTLLFRIYKNYTAKISKYCPNLPYLRRCTSAFIQGNNYVWCQAS